MSVYEKNLEALGRFDPVLASRLFSIGGNTKYDVYADPKDQLNVNIVDTYLQTPLYEGIPLESTLKYVDDFEKVYGSYPVVYFYGFGSGLATLLLLKNENHLRTVIIEPEIELIYIALNLFDFSEALTTRRLLIFTSDQITFPLAIDLFSASAYKVFCKIFHIDFTLPYYAQNYGEQALECVQNMTRAIEHVVYGLGNDSTDALIGLEWHVANAPLMAKTPTFYELVRKVKNGTDTAIIISTGPSLAKQLPLLQKIKNHVTLMCVDASFPILEKWGIKPDVVFSIERVIETAEFYKRVSPEFQKDVIFALSSLVHPLLPRAITQGTIQMSMRPFGYTRFMKMEEYGYLGIGMSAANMAYELSFHGKFKNIILIGQDLSYGENGQTHSDGHIYGSSKERDDDIWVEAYGGEKTVRTSKVWHMFRNFFEQDIAIANQEGVVTVNATEGGARIHGAIELSFEEAISQYVDMTKVKNLISLTTPTQDEINKRSSYVTERLAYLEEYAVRSQKEASDLFEDLVKMTNYLKTVDLKNNIDDIDFDEITALMSKIDDLKAKFDDDEFVDVFIDATQALIVHQELDLARIQVRAVKTDEERKAKMIDWLFAHEAWLFGLAGLMDAEVVAIKRRGQDSHFVHKAKLSINGTSVQGKFYDYNGARSDLVMQLFVDGEMVLEKEHNTTLNTTGAFSVSIPARFFNDCVHDLMVREKMTGMVPFGMPERRALLSEDRSVVVFMESLDHVDTEKIKDMYCANAIGFLATEENLADEDFINYLQVLKVRIPNIKLKAIYFNKQQFAGIQALESKIKIEKCVMPECLEDILTEIEIFVWNANINSLDIAQYVPFYVQMLRYCSNIYCFEYSFHMKNCSLQEADEKLAKVKKSYTENFHMFGFKHENNPQKNNFFQAVYNEIIFELGIVLDKEVATLNQYDVSIQYVQYALKTPKFKKLLYDIHAIELSI